MPSSKTQNACVAVSSMCPGAPARRSALGRILQKALLRRLSDEACKSNLARCVSCHAWAVPLKRRRRAYYFVWGFLGLRVRRYLRGARNLDRAVRRGGAPAQACDIAERGSGFSECCWKCLFRGFSVRCSVNNLAGVKGAPARLRIRSRPMPSATRLQLMPRLFAA